MSSAQGNGPYYLATAFDRIYLQPSGSLGLTGVVVERLFFRSALDKAGVSFEAGQRSEYKTAAHALTETGFTGPAREENEHLAAGVAGQLTSAIADRRGKTPDEARALLDRGPFLPQQALAEGLVDVLGYRDEAYAAIKQKAGQDAVLQYLTRYQRSANLAQRARKLPEPAGTVRGRGLRHRPDPDGTQRPRPDVRPVDGLGHDRRGAAVRRGRRAGRRDPAPGQQPGWFGHRVRHDLA